MTDDGIEASLKNGLGRVQSAVGDLAGDVRTQTKGEFNRASDAVHDSLSQVRGRAQTLYDQVQDQAKEQPLLALGVALGVGVFLGGLLLSGRKTIYVTK